MHILLGRVALAAILLLVATLLQAQDEPSFDVHQWSVWMVDPMRQEANAKDHYASSLPGLAGSLRGGVAKTSLAPLTLTTFAGDAVDSLDVVLKVPQGRVLAHWPRGEEKSLRLQWLGASLSPPADTARWAYVAPGHWFHQARRLAASDLKLGIRQERFLACDVELELACPLRLAGGPEVYQVSNAAKHPLHDLAVLRPTTKGLCVGWVDELAPEGTASVTMSEPLSPESEALRQQSSAALRQRLMATGLPAAEIDLLLAIYEDAFFKPREMVVLCRLGSNDVDRLLPLEVLPEPRKTVRTALLLATNIDPGLGDVIAGLVRQLGSPEFARREAAETRLAELGSLATAALKLALKSKDLEVVYRAERLLRRQVPNSADATE